MLRDRLTTFGEIVACILIAVGFGLFSVALGVIVAGVLLGVVSYLAADPLDDGRSQ